MKQALSLFTIVIFVFSFPALSWAAGTKTNKTTSQSKPKATISLKIGKLGNIKISL